MHFLGPRVPRGCCCGVGEHFVGYSVPRRHFCCCSGTVLGCFRSPNVLLVLLGNIFGIVLFPDNAFPEAEGAPWVLLWRWGTFCGVFRSPNALLLLLGNGLRVISFPDDTFVAVGERFRGDFVTFYCRETDC